MLRTLSVPFMTGLLRRLKQAPRWLNSRNNLGTLNRIPVDIRDGREIPRVIDHKIGISRARPPGAAVEEREITEVKYSTEVQGLRDLPVVGSTCYSFARIDDGTSGGRTMTYVVTERCVNSRYTECVADCPRRLLF